MWRPSNSSVQLPSTVARAVSPNTSTELTVGSNRLKVIRPKPANQVSRSMSEVPVERTPTRR
jgi:hypothetical protein